MPRAAKRDLVGSPPKADHANSVGVGAAASHHGVFVFLLRQGRNPPLPPLYTRGAFSRVPRPLGFRGEGSEIPHGAIRPQRSIASARSSTAPLRFALRMTRSVFAWAFVVGAARSRGGASSTTLLRRAAVEFARRFAAAQDGTKVKTLRGSVFIRGVTEIRKNEASAVPSAHFDYISGRGRSVPSPTLFACSAFVVGVTRSRGGTSPPRSYGVPPWSSLACFAAAQDDRKGGKGGGRAPKR